MAKKRKEYGLDDPLLHPDHERPVSRRDFLRLGLAKGAGVVTGLSLFSLFADPRAASAALSADLAQLAADAGCPLGGPAGNKIPFICFDLAGGANFAASNVLVGQAGSQLEFLSVGGYNKLGLRGDEVPMLTPVGGGSFIDTRLGLAFHRDSQLLRGITERAASVGGNVHGAVIPARSENDTGNNPHNPMYGIARYGLTPPAGAQTVTFGQIATLIGSTNSESGGNSLAPSYLIDPSIRPTKIDRPSDVTGLVDTGKLVGLLTKDDAVAVLESVARLSNGNLGRLSTGVPTREQVIKDLLHCGYISAADLADRFAGVPIDPSQDADIVGPGGIFSTAEFNGDGEFRKTASVMKMVIDGYAGAGTITMGGYDYHTGDRVVGDARDLRAGRCIGACLEYAARKETPVMIYVFSDGSVFSNGMEDPNNGRLVWTGDNQQGACSFFLVYNPGGQPQPRTAIAPGQGGPQLGWFRASGDVETASSPAANNVNLLVETVVLNYMALHGDEGQFATLFPNHGLGNATQRDSLTAFQRIEIA